MADKTRLGQHSLLCPLGNRTLKAIIQKEPIINVVGLNRIVLQDFSVCLDTIAHWSFSREQLHMH